MDADSPSRRLDPTSLAEALIGRRAIFLGDTGTGKSTLVSRVADHLPTTAQSICADPGSPGFGAPTTVSRARRKSQSWHVEAFEAIGSLDAGKFRLSILGAVAHLLRGLDGHTVLIDAPGIHRGGMAREFVAQLIAISRADVAVYLAESPEDSDLLPALQSSGVEIWSVEPSPQASRPSSGERRRARTDAWDAFLDRKSVV